MYFKTDKICVLLYKKDENDLTEQLNFGPENNWKITPEGLYWSWTTESGIIRSLIPWHRIRCIEQIFTGTDPVEINL